MKCKQVARGLIKRLAQVATAGLLAVSASGVLAQVVATPGGVSVTTSPGRTAQLSWSPNNDAGCASYTYDVQRSTAPSGNSYITIATVSATSHTDNLQSLLRYNYRIAANCTPSAPGPVISSAASAGLAWAAPLMEPTSVAASKGTFTDRIDFVVNATKDPLCVGTYSIYYAFPAGPTQIFAMPDNGPSTYTFSDYTSTTGYRNYVTFAHCALSSGGTAFSSSFQDYGYLGVPVAPPISVSASKYVYTTQVRIRVEYPAMPTCIVPIIVVNRNGQHYTNIGVQRSGGTEDIWDINAPLGEQTYMVRMDCGGVAGAISNGLIDIGARRYPNASCSSISLGQSIVNYGPGATNSVTVSGVTNTASARLRVLSAREGANVSHYGLTGGAQGAAHLPWSDATGSINLDNHSPGYPDYGTILVQAMLTGLNPGEPEQLCASNSFTLAGGVPTGLQASDGTVVNGVNITWDPVAGIENYHVAECQGGAGQPNFGGPSGVQMNGQSCQVMQATGGSFSRMMAGTTHDARVYAVYGVDGNGTPVTQMSAPDAGYPDRAPASTSAMASMAYGAAQAVLSPIVNDVNPNEVFTFLLPNATTAFGGSATVVGSTIVYRPPTPVVVGNDTFNFTVRDKAGATVTGTGTVAIACAAPTVGAINALPARIFPNAGYRLNVGYGNQNCPHSAEGRVVVRSSGGQEVGSATVTGLQATMSSTFAADLPGIETPGIYTATVTVRDAIDNTEATRTFNLEVAAFVMPTMSASTSAMQYVDRAQANVRSSVDCAVTTSMDAALADRSRCLIVPSGLPPGVTEVAGQATPSWAGYSPTPGDYTVTMAVQQADPSGTMRTLGTLTAPTRITALNSMVFGSASPLSSSLHFKQTSVIVTQTAGPSCSVTTDRSVAEAAARLGASSRRCLITYGNIPADFTVTPTALSGTLHSVPSTPVAWAVSIFDPTGVERAVGNGSVTMDVRALDVSYRLGVNPSAPAASVSNVTVQLSPTGTDKCSLTLDANAAKMANYCLLEWRNIPAGLSQSPRDTIPLLRGMFQTSGEIAIPFDLSVFGTDGQKYPVISASPTVTVVAPPQPTINLYNMQEVSNGVYFAPLDGGVYGSIGNCTGCGAVTITQTIEGDAKPRVTSIISTAGRQILYGSPAALWAQRGAVIRVALAYATSHYVERTVQILSVPPRTTRVILTVDGQDVPDNQPVRLKAVVGNPGSGGFRYDAATLGNWRVRFGSQDSTGTFTPLTGWVNTDASGEATGTVDPSGQIIMKLAAQAEPVAPMAVPGLGVTSTVKVVRVVKGSPISGRIEASATVGPAPLLTVIKVVYTTRSDQVANKGVTWSRSEDGGASWTAVPDKTDPVFVVRISEGSASFKAHFVNANTDVPSETAPITIEAFGVPTLTVSGNNYSFPGTTVNVTAQSLRADGTPQPSPVFEWSAYLRGSSPGSVTPIATGNTSTASFTSPDAGVYLVKFRTRLSTSPAEDQRSWSEKIHQVVFSTAQKPSVRVSGPLRVEAGKPYQYTAVVSTPFAIAGSPLTVGGEWTLPNGSKVPGATLNWSPTAADAAMGNAVKVTYSAWIEGYKEETIASASTTSQIWAYVFPGWRAAVQVGSPIVPATATIAMIADDAGALKYLEGLTFTWNLPSGMTAVRTPTSKLDALINFGGTYSVGVRVSDSRGNNYETTVAVTVQDPPPFVMDIAVSKISKWSHAPLTVGVTPRVTGGHPDDRLLNWQYLIDGQPVDGLPNRPGVQLVLQNPQTYSVEAVATSKLGATVRRTVAVSAPGNVGPTCGLTSTMSINRRQSTLKVSCTDPDGSIVRYDWTVNGVPRPGVSSLWTYVIPTGTPLPVRVDVTATDDGGLNSTATVMVE